MRRLSVTILLAVLSLSVSTVPAAAGVRVQTSVVHARVSAPGQAPWIVGLNIDQGTSKARSCAGTLVTHYVVLTAAHCVVGSHSWYITAGQQTFRGLGQNLADAYRGGSAIYDSRYGTNSANKHYAGYDFALIGSETYIPEPIIQVDNSLSLAYGHYFNVFGWGAVDQSGTKLSRRLRRGIVKLYHDSACRDKSVGAQLCAGLMASGTQACHGDSGGPLTWGVGPAAVQVGVVSYGLSGTCGAGRSIYGFVAQSDWLQTWLHHYGAPGW